MNFQKVAKPCKTIENIVSQMQKRVAKTLIKPVELQDFGADIRKSTQNDQKALPREGFRNTFSKCRHTL